MKDTPGVDVAQVAAIAAGLTAVVIVSRGASAVARFVLHELDYRAGDGIETWFRALRSP